MKLRTYSDGGARGNPGPAAVGVVIADEKGVVVEETARCIGRATNNVAEYEALTLAMELALARGAERLTCYGDSELIIFQMQGVYRIKDARLQELAKKARAVAARLKSVEFRQVPRTHPMIVRADRLLNQALNKAQTGGGQTVERPSQGELF